MLFLALFKLQPKFLVTKWHLLSLLSSEFIANLSMLFSVEQGSVKSIFHILYYNSTRELSPVLQTSKRTLSPLHHRPTEMMHGAVIWSFPPAMINLFCFILFFLFTIFILHSRESELSRYVVDGMSALAWELLFPRCLGHLPST